MTDKKKSKDKPKVPSRRKDISTFSKLMEDQRENQKKQIKALFGSPSRLADHLKLLSRIDKDKILLGLPSEIELENIRRQVENLPLDFEEIISVREPIPDYLLNELENSKFIIDSQQMFESILSININEQKKLEGMLMDLQIHDIQKSLDEYKTLNVDIKEFKPVKPTYNEFLLTARTRESIEIGNIKLKTVQDTQLQVLSLKGDVNEIKETIIQDANKKDEMLEELLDYLRNGGSSTVKVEKVKYNKKTAELMINNKTINIKADTNQHYLCKILFASKTSMTKVWEIYDIVEAWGENTEILDVWKEVIYNTVRRLNEKIQQQTGPERFILYNNKTIIVNPKHLKLP
ncbi:MAG: hypothetical protein IH948_08175 [Bacteroidetes bacterium]|nr:hypothetical protein [Bacteroidota bacterium]